MKIAKIESCQNWKWFQYFLLKVSIFDEFKIAEIESCQNWKLPKLEIGKIESCQFRKGFQYFLLKVSMYFWWIKLKIAKIESCQNRKLLKLKFAKIAIIESCQIVNCHKLILEVAKLWTCDLGAKSLFDRKIHTTGKLGIFNRVQKLAIFARYEF